MIQQSPLSRKAGQSHLTSLLRRIRVFARGAAEDAEIRDSRRGDRQVARLSVAPCFVTPIRFVHDTGDLPVAPTRILAAPRLRANMPGRRAKTSRRETAKVHMQLPCLVGEGQSEGSGAGRRR